MLGSPVSHQAVPGKNETPCELLITNGYNAITVTTDQQVAAAIVLGKMHAGQHTSLADVSHLSDCRATRGSACYIPIFSVPYALYFRIELLADRPLRGRISKNQAPAAVCLQYCQ